MASQLTAESVQLRTSELFPPGATTPAVKPRLPPVVKEPTNELARLVFDASGRVKRVKGLLAGEEASGYIIADHLGIELLKEEALTLGESVRKAAIGAKKKDDALKSTARAKKSRLRMKGNSEDEPAVVRAVQEIDTKLAADRAALRAETIELNGLPDRNSVIVEPRAPKPPPPPVPPTAPTPEPEPEPELEIDERARAILALACSDEVGEAIRYAFWVMNERRFGKEVDINGGLEMTLVGYKHALRELQEAQPGEFVNFKPEEPMRMVEWAVRCEATGHSIPAAVAVAEQIGFPLQQVAAEHAKRVPA